MNKMKKVIINISKILTSCFFAVCISPPAIVHAAQKPVTRVNSQPIVNAFAEFYKEYRIALNFTIAIALFTSIGIFIYLLCKLAAHGNNPQVRSETINNLVICGVCTGILGGLSVIYAYFVLTIIS